MELLSVFLVVFLVGVQVGSWLPPGRYFMLLAS